ncbi:DnaJ family domain-containing protein [Biostraticola tofi]|uniref:Uncharacterized protein DUF1992 n=1 Tax=Biostraticola tofi TaxID=466109 RepID=A0A4R3YFL9_9GAMM|nr:DUF1992 domain-containing protein [Biostraticola tofi]TCV91355.1 uncharacterized protein DUF1992 [Biostraticola tofi]
MGLVDDWAERHIQTAQRAGEFDNLPGAGKPLALDDDSAVPEALRSSYRLLKNSGYLPPELEDRQQALTLAEMLGSIDHTDPLHATIAKKLMLLEMRLRQSGISTDFLHTGYRQQLQQHFEPGGY